MPLSPQNIAALKAGPWKDRYDDACSPEPATVPLTDILLDAWSMTSIRERMPGRPDVGPWLRGIDDELPQTTIAWRAELDEPGFADLSLGDIEEWFDTHRILTHETLSVPTSAAAKWFADRWEKLDDKQKSEVGKRSIVVDRAGLKLVTVKDVIDQLSRKNTDSIRFAELILPASFGGIERHVGLLNAEAPKNPEDAKNADDPTRRDNAKARLVAPDVADLAEGLRRQREIITRTEDGEPETRIIGGGTPPPNPAHFRIELTSDDDCVARLVSHVPKREKLEYGSTKQTLQQHVDEVCKAADRILSRTAIASYFTAKLSRIRCRTSVERHAR
jgi:CRISPR-associated endonuclease/helicase Cas3